mgnify:CR=1 FL=1
MPTWPARTRLPLTLCARLLFLCMCVYGSSPPHKSVARPETLLDSPPDMTVKRPRRRLRPWQDCLAQNIFLRMAVDAPRSQPSATAPPSLRCVEQPLLLAAATLPVLAASASRLCTFVLCMRLAYCMSRDAHVHCLACARRRSSLERSQARSTRTFCGCPGVRRTTGGARASGAAAAPAAGCGSATTHSGASA